MIGRAPKGRNSLTRALTHARPMATGGGPQPHGMYAFIEPLRQMPHAMGGHVIPYNPTPNARAGPLYRPGESITVRPRAPPVLHPGIRRQGLTNGQIAAILLQAAHPQMYVARSPSRVPGSPRKRRRSRSGGNTTPEPKSSSKSPERKKPAPASGSRGEPHAMGGAPYRVFGRAPKGKTSRLLGARLRI